MRPKLGLRNLTLGITTKTADELHAQDNSFLKKVKINIIYIYIDIDIDTLTYVHTYVYNCIYIYTHITHTYIHNIVLYMCVDLYDCMHLPPGQLHLHSLAWNGHRAVRMDDS